MECLLLLHGQVGRAFEPHAFTFRQNLIPTLSEFFMLLSPNLVDPYLPDTWQHGTGQSRFSSLHSQDTLWSLECTQSTSPSPNSLQLGRWSLRIPTHQSALFTSNPHIQYHICIGYHRRVFVIRNLSHTNIRNYLLLSLVYLPHAV